MDVHKMLSMGSTISSLEKAVHAKDNQLEALSAQIHELGVVLAEKEGNVSALTAALDTQTQQLNEVKEQVSQTKMEVIMNSVCLPHSPRWTKNSELILIKLSSSSLSKELKWICCKKS